MNEPDTTLDQRFSDPDATPAGWDETRRMLEEAQLSWICTVRADGRPHLTPLVAVWLDGALYFCTGAGEQKAVNLRGNPHVLLLTGCHRWDEGLDVVAEGDAVRVTDDALLTRLAQAWAGKWDGQWQFQVRDGAFEQPGDGRGRRWCSRSGRPRSSRSPRAASARHATASLSTLAEPTPAGGPMDTLLPGITAERVPTSRLTVNVLSVAGRTRPREPRPVLFVHGNVSSSLFWQPMMLALPETFRPLAIDLRGFGDTDDEPVDATRGVRDFSDDLAAAIEALGLDTVHLVGWSMGGGVVLQYLVDRPGAHRVASLTLVDPVSPFGFGGTKGVDGMLCDPWGAGSGAGGANPEFVERLAGKDRTDKSVLSPRQVLLAHYVKPPHVPEHLDIFVESMLSTRVGEYHYPGDLAPGGRLAGLRARRPRRAQHHGPHAFPDRRPVGGGTQAAGALAARRRRRHRLRHLPVRPGLPGLDRRDPRLARRAGLAAAAHGGADPGRAERLRRGRRPLPRGGHRGRGPRPAPGPAGAVPGRTNGSSSRPLTARCPGVERTGGLSRPDARHG